MGFGLDMSSVTYELCRETQLCGGVGNDQRMGTEQVGKSVYHNQRYRPADPIVVL